MLEKREWSYSSDLWALGVIIYQMLTGNLLFKGKTQDKTFELIQKGEFTMADDIPESAKSLIKQLLVLKPENRLGAFDLNELMKHEFFDGINFDTIGQEEPPVKFTLNKI